MKNNIKQFYGREIGLGLLMLRTNKDSDELRKQKQTKILRKEGAGHRFWVYLCCS